MPTSAISKKIANIKATLHGLAVTASYTLRRKLSTSCVIETLAGANCIATSHPVVNNHADNGIIFRALSPPQGFGPRGPKPEEAKIVDRACV